MDKSKRAAIAKGKRGEPGPGKERAAMPALPRMPGQKAKGKGKALRPCACGNCGKMTKTTWFPGHDAICKSWALRVHRDICKIGEVPAEHREGAKRLLPTLKDVGKIAPKTALKLASRGKADGKKGKGKPKGVKAKVATKSKPLPRAKKGKKLPGSVAEDPSVKANIEDQRAHRDAKVDAAMDIEPVTDAELGTTAADVEESESEGQAVGE